MRNDEVLHLKSFDPLSWSRYWLRKPLCACIKFTFGHIYNEFHLLSTKDNHDFEIINDIILILSNFWLLPTISLKILFLLGSQATTFPRNKCHNTKKMFALLILCFFFLVLLFSPPPPPPKKKGVMVFISCILYDNDPTAMWMVVVDEEPCYHVMIIFLKNAWYTLSWTTL